MFVREKRICSHTCLYLAESVRENGHTKHRTVKKLGRNCVVGANGMG
jgi:hypothetical protein